MNSACPAQFETNLQTNDRESFKTLQRPSKLFYYLKIGGTSFDENCEFFRVSNYTAVIFDSVFSIFLIKRLPCVSFTSPSDTSIFLISITLVICMSSVH